MDRRKITVGSSFERLRQYGDGDYTHYRSIPGTITLEQPLFGFNRIKWLQRIEPVKYREASRKRISDREEVTLTVIQYYFDLLAGQTNLDISVQNLDNAERLYGITEAQHRIGRQSEIDLMQMKQTLLNAQSALTDAQISLEARMFQLRSFLGIDESVVLQAVVPSFIAERIPTLRYREVVELALQNNPFTQNIQKGCSKRRATSARPKPTGGTSTCSLRSACRERPTPSTGRTVRTTAATTR